MESKRQEEEGREIIPFWTPGLPEGVLSNRPCPLVRGPWSVVRPLVRL